MTHSPDLLRAGTRQNVVRTYLADMSSHPLTVATRAEFGCPADRVRAALRATYVPLARRISPYGMDANGQSGPSELPSVSTLSETVCLDKSMS